MVGRVTPGQQNPEKPNGGWNLMMLNWPWRARSQAKSGSSGSIQGTVASVVTAHRPVEMAHGMGDSTEFSYTDTGFRGRRDLDPSFSVSLEVISLTSLNLTSYH